MAHKVMRLSKEILSKPQLITQEKFEEIAEYLENRNNSNDFQLEKFEREREKEGILYEGNRETGIIKIYGPLTYREPMGIAALCGDVPSYESILRDAAKLCKDPDIKNIVLDIDSGGGQAYRCFSTARQLRKMADDNGKKLITYCDGMAASAAYALGAASHEFVIIPDAEAGSIGVVIRLASNNRQVKESGVDVKYIQAGASKTPFDEEGAYKEDFISGLQSRVDKLYDKFIDHVATMRNIEPQVVRDTEAKVFDAEEALELGLVDSIMEAEEFKEKYLKVADEIGGGNNNSSPLSIAAKSDETIKTKANKMSENTVDMAAHEELLAKLAQYEAKEAERELSAKKDEIKTSLSGATFLEDVDGVVEFLVGAEEAQATMLNNVISQASAALEAQKTEAAAVLAAKEEELSSEITKLSGEVETAKGEAIAAKEEAKQVKEEFGTSEQQSEAADLQKLQDDASLEGQNIAKGVELMLARINKQ